MRNVKPLMVYNLVFVAQNVEIDIPRPLVDDLSPTHGVFNLLKLIQQLKRLQRCLNLRFHSVS